MTVMTAGMHHTLCLTGIGKTGFLNDGQGVDIGADTQTLVTMTTFQGGDDAMAPDTLGHLISEGEEVTGNESRRALFPKRKLRMSVKIVPDGDAFLDEGKDSPFGVVLRTRAVNADIHGSGLLRCALPAQHLEILSGRQWLSPDPAFMRSPCWNRFQRGNRCCP